MRRRRALIAIALLGGCAEVGGSSDDAATRGDGPPADIGSDIGFDGADTTTCPQIPCVDGRWCDEGRCLREQSCDDDRACQDDSFCDPLQRRCLPYGARRERREVCSNVGFAAEALRDPAVQCQWRDGEVIMAPVVADLDGDALPEIIFVTWPGGDLVAVRGDDCAEVFRRNAGLASRSQLAVGDLEANGDPEIVGVTNAHRVVIHDRNGAPLAWSEPAALDSSTNDGRDGGPAIADLDGQAPAEVVYGGLALRLELDAQGWRARTLFNVPLSGGQFGALSAVADVDLDGTPEIIAGNAILDGLSGTDETPSAVAAWSGGYPAIAQLDATPEPEVILVSSYEAAAGVLRAFHPTTGQLVLGPLVVGSQWGGPPTVADVDGDGRPEIGVAGYEGYFLFDVDCAAEPLPADCAASGLRWRAVTQDHSSGSTGSTVFDFNGDGRAEVVYRDECWLRIYDGASGAVRFAASLTSGTILDYPLVADVDGDGHAEIVVPSTDAGADPAAYCPPEGTRDLPVAPLGQGVTVLEDPDNRWMPARPIWNQHTYHITNVDDDATVPEDEPSSWQAHNSYRQNTPALALGPIPAPDLTARQSIEPPACADGQLTLVAEVCNRGRSNAPAEIAATFYRGDPAAGGRPICSAATAAVLPPGACEAVRCADPEAARGAQRGIWLVVDDDGVGVGSEFECLEQNNRLALPTIHCPEVD